MIGNKGWVTLCLKLLMMIMDFLELDEICSVDFLEFLELEMTLL